MSSIRMALCLMSFYAVFGAFGGPVDLPNPFGNVYALVVGVEDYRNCDWGDLDYAIDDAEQMSELFINQFGYKTTILRDATGDEILSAVDQILASIGPDDVFLFFYAGHGQSIPASSLSDYPVGYFVPRMEEDLTKLVLADVREEILETDLFDRPHRIEETDDQPGQSEEEYSEMVEAARTIWISEVVKKEHDLRLIEGSLRMDELRSKLFNSRAKHVIALFDSCFAGLSTRSGSGVASKMKLENEALIRHYQLLSAKSRFVFTAGTGGEQAIEHTSKTRGYSQMRESKPLPKGGSVKHGVFTYELLSVLQQIPSEGLSVSAVHQEVRKRVSGVMQVYGFPKTMTPQLRPYSISGGEFVFVRKPSNDWLLRTRDAVEHAIANAKKGGKGRGGLEAIELVFQKDSKMAQRQADINRLESKAFVVLAFQAGLSGQQSNMSNDAVWVQRFDESMGKASSGDPDAMAALYYMYQYGLGTAKNNAQARHWAAESASSDSSDAHQAWADALENGIGFEGTAGYDDRKKALEQASAKRDAGQKTAATAAAAGVLAIGSDHKKLGIASLTVAAAAYVQGFKDKPEESIENSIAKMSLDIKRLGSLIDEIGVRGDIDLKEFDILKASLQTRQRNINQQVRNESSGARGRETVLFLIGSTSKELGVALQRVAKPVVRKRYEPSREEFAKLELAYAKLIAIMPYQMNNVSW